MARSLARHRVSLNRMATLSTRAPPPLDLSWSLSTALRGQMLAAKELENGAVLRATVTGNSSAKVLAAGGASVRLTFASECGQISPGGWLVGLRAPGATQFAPAIGGATAKRKDARALGTGVLDAMVMTGHRGAGAVTYLREDELRAYLPVGAEVTVAPIWQCTDFFSTKRQFDEADANGDGHIDAAELAELARACAGPESTAADVAAAAADALARGDANRDGLIDYDEFCSAGFDVERLRLRLRELAAKAGGLCDAMHAVPPWRGELPAAADRATLLENTGVGDERRAA